jgi:hypothetical protein
MDFTKSSPDGQQHAQYRFAGEIRFGPAYYTLEIGDLAFARRLFGERGLWSPDSRYFAAEEWLSTDESKGPHTRLLVVDISARREFHGGQAISGFVQPQRFEDTTLLYDKLYYPHQTVEHFSVDLAAANWKAID